MFNLNSFEWNAVWGYGETCEVVDQATERAAAAGGKHRNDNMGQRHCNRKCAHCGVLIYIYIYIYIGGDLAINSIVLLCTASKLYVEFGIISKALEQSSRRAQKTPTCEALSNRLHLRHPVLLPRLQSSLRWCGTKVLR